MTFSSVVLGDEVFKLYMLGKMLLPTHADESKLRTKQQV